MNWPWTSRHWSMMGGSHCQCEKQKPSSRPASHSAYAGVSWCELRISTWYGASGISETKRSSAATNSSGGGASRART